MNKEKNHGIFVFVLMIVFFVGISIFCYYKFYLEKKDDKQLVNLDSSLNNEQINVDSNIYKLMSSATGGNYEDGFSNALDNKMGYDFDTNQSKKVSDLDTNAISLLVYNYALNNNYLNHNKNSDSLSEENVKKIYNRIFGPYLEYQVIKKSNMCPTLSFDNSKKIYNYKKDCKNKTDISRYNKIIAVEEEENKIVVTEQIGYYTSAILENNVFITYKDAVNKTNSIGTIVESTEIQMTNLKKSLSRYKYTFKKWNNQYYFYSIERIK